MLDRHRAESGTNAKDETSDGNLSTSLSSNDLWIVKGDFDDIFPSPGESLRGEAWEPKPRAITISLSENILKIKINPTSSKHET
jgi:hypothetical protein